MRVLILHMRFHPDPTGTGPLVTDLALGLSRMGDGVTVITSVPHYGMRGVSAGYGTGLARVETWRGVRVWRTAAYRPPNPKGVHRSLNYLSFTVMSVLVGLLAGEHDVLLCVNPPLTTGFSGWCAGLFRRIPLVLNVQDIWPACLLHLGQLRNPVLTRILQVLERRLYTVSSRVIVLSPGMKETLVSRGVPETKVQVVPNWTHPESIRPVVKENDFRRNHGLTGKFVVLFAGNIGYASVLETVLGAADQLREDLRIQFVIAGEGNAKPALIDRADVLALPNVQFLPTQPQSRVPEMLGASDVCLVTLHRGLGRLNVPSKINTILAAGRPVLATVPEDSEIRHMVAAAKAGICVPAEDSTALADAVERLSRNPESLARFGQNGRLWAEGHLGFSLALGRYREVLRQAAKSPRGRKSARQAPI